MTNILVVEDDRIVARDIRQQLEAMGHAVCAVTADGANAPALASASKADIVLMDIRLSGPVDGIQAAQTIREQCDIPVIFLTAYADDETIRRANLTEPFGYLLKPFETTACHTGLCCSLKSALGAWSFFVVECSPISHPTAQ